MTEALNQTLIQGRLISTYQVYRPSGEKKGGVETGFAEKFEKEPFYRLHVTEPAQVDFFIMPGRGGRKAAFRVFSEIRDRKGKFIAWSHDGDAEWSSDRKGIYVTTRHPEAEYLIVLEPSNFPYWGIDARK